jgi:acetylornithine/succinyldiaminopimelate/putrescine aminotransferase
MTAMTRTEAGAPVAERAPAAGIVKPALMSVEDAKALDVNRMAELFKAHLNPGQFHFMKLLGFHKVKVERAEGMYYIDQNGRKILDFFGGFGSLAFGHNHPRILAARQKFQEEKRHEIAIAFMSQYAAALAHNLAQCSPGDLDMVFLGSSGSEAMEAAVKLAERAAGPKRPKVVYAENSFHGKTKGVLAVTDGKLYRGEFRLTENTVRVPFGDIEAVENAFRSDPEIGAIVLETVQGGGGIIEADPALWPKLRELCDRYGVLWVADEVQCGFGRTGRFYAFEHYGVVPDITALAKSLGAGKAALDEIVLDAAGLPHRAQFGSGPEGVDMVDRAAPPSDDGCSCGGARCAPATGSPGRCTASSPVDPLIRRPPSRKPVTDDSELGRKPVVSDRFR